MRPNLEQFAEIVAEPVGTVSARWAAGEVWPNPSHDDPDAGRFARFGWADAVAWAIARDLVVLGMSWPEAAAVTRDSYAARWAIKQPSEARGTFFAVWHSAVETGAAVPPQYGRTTWLGTAAEIAEVIDHDAGGDVSGTAILAGITSVRMVSLHRCMTRARFLAARARWRVAGGALELAAAEGVMA